MVVGQKVALGRVHAGKTVTINVTDTELAIACDDGTRTVRRATDQPVRNLKASRPRKKDRAAAVAGVAGTVDGMLTDLSYHPIEVTSWISWS
ncbi:hypothetical protein ACH47V_31040 [Micromonospora chersina]